jgi:hypothetical protein
VDRRVDGPAARAGWKLEKMEIYADNTCFSTSALDLNSPGVPIGR